MLLLLLLLDGSWVRALVPAFGIGLSLAASTPILRLMVVGSRLRLHTIPAFISIIGGLLLFGAPGLILGPLAVTMTMLIVEFWTRREVSNQTSV